MPGDPTDGPHCRISNSRPKCGPLHSLGNGFAIARPFIGDSREGCCECDGCVRCFVTDPQAETWGQRGNTVRNDPSGCDERKNIGHVGVGHGIPVSQSGFPVPTGDPAWSPRQGVQWQAMHRSGGHEDQVWGRRFTIPGRRFLTSGCCFQQRGDHRNYAVGNASQCPFQIVGELSECRGISPSEIGCRGQGLFGDRRPLGI